MIERRIEVTTSEGEMPTFVFHPTHGGPHPVVMYLMDAPSIRPALVDMATRLSSAPRPSDSAACAVVWSGPGRTTMSAAMSARARCEARVRRGGQQRSKGQQAQRIGMACMSARAWNAGCAAAAVGCGCQKTLPFLSKIIGV